MTPSELLEKYKMAYKQADILDGVIANAINGHNNELPSYSDADIAAKEKDPRRREELMRRMTDAALVNEGHVNRLTGRLIGGVEGLIGGAAAGNVAQLASGGPGLTGPVLGGIGGMMLGGYLGDRMVKSFQLSRRARYARALREKVRALRGE